MRTKQLEIIKCPNCGYEYLPAEIYVARSLVGTPQGIIRDIEGKIEHFSGRSMDCQETYCCDHCNKSFKVSAKVSFTTNKIDTNEIFVQQLHKPKLFLDETTNDSN